MARAATILMAKPEFLIGKLEEQPFAELLSSIKNLELSGTLRLARGVHRARVQFQHGEVVSARVPGIKRLGDLLVSTGLADPISVQAAARIQAEEQGRRPLGEILRAHGIVEPDTLKEVIRQQLDQSLQELGAWRSGRFEFDLEVTEEPSAAPAPPVETGGAFTTRRGRTRESTPSGAAEVAPTAADVDAVSVVPLKPTLLIESSDADLIADLDLNLATERLELASIAVSANSQTFLPQASVFVIDLRLSQTPALTLRGRVASAGASPVLAVVADAAGSAALYCEGPLAVIPADVAALSTALRTLLRLVPLRMAPAQPSAGAGAQTPHLGGVFGALGPSSASATVALDLMQAIAPFVERAVLFLVGGKNLTVGGAFGMGTGGKLLAELTKGLEVDLSTETAMTSAVRTKRALSLDFEAAHLPFALTRALGPPLTGQSIILPVSGGQSVVAVLYADNGAVSQWISDLDPLRAAAEHYGPSFETELLIGEAARTLI